MRTAVTIVAECAACALLLTIAAAAPALHTQAPSSEATVTPIGELKADWLNEGAESPNGRFFVFRSYQDDAFLRYDRSTRQWASASDVELGTQLRWSPDGRFLAFARTGAIRNRSVWLLPMDSSTGMPRGSARRISARPASWPAWSPDGRRIAFADQDSGRFRLVTMPFNGGDEEVLFDKPGTGGDIAWSPDGKYLLANHRPSPEQPIASLRLDVTTKRVDPHPFSALRILGYSGNGQLVAHYDPAGSLVVISSAVNGRTVQKVWIPRSVRPVGWSRSTPNAISGLQHVVPSHIQRVSLPDGRIETLTPTDSSPIHGVMLSADGRQMAFIGGAASLVQVKVANIDGSRLRAVGARGDISSLRWSPSAQQIAYSMDGPTAGIRLVDLTSGVDRTLIALNGNATVHGELAWRSDGRAVRYIRHPRGEFFPEREVREVALNGIDRLIAPISASQGDPYFINDTLLLVKQGTGIEAINLRTGSVRSVYKGAMRGQSPFGISRDGEWVAFSADSSGGPFPQLLSLATGATRPVPYSLKGELAMVDFHPDGRHLIGEACLTCATGLEKWDVVLIPMNGEPARILTATESSYKDFSSARSSPDGRYLIFSAEQSYNTRVVRIDLPRSR